MASFLTMDDNCPYEFIGFGAMDNQFPCGFISFKAMDDNCLYEFKGFGAMDGQASL